MTFMFLWSIIHSPYATRVNGVLNALYVPALDNAAAFIATNEILWYQFGAFIVLFNDYFFRIFYIFHCIFQQFLLLLTVLNVHGAHENNIVTDTQYNARCETEKIIFFFLVFIHISNFLALRAFMNRIQIILHLHSQQVNFYYLYYFVSN